MERTERTVDVVVVGGGIAGSSIAAQLGAAGLDVIVLEQSEQFRDRVRGETIVPWGVREVVRLGLEHVLLGAGGQYATAFVPYDDTLTPDAAEASVFPIGMVAPDVGGQLNVGHPEASQALLDHAISAGADVRRGTSAAEVEAGAAPSVAWTENGERHRARCRLVIGADGRTSTVRRQIGLELEEREPTVFGAGLLVRTADGLEAANAFGTEGQNCFLAFPRSDDLTRLYLMVDIARQREFTGPRRTETFLRSMRAKCFPASEAYATAEVAGPCGGAPMTDSWTTTDPVVPGVVLIGDSAGWNDPIIGQGLSIAFRDARMVSEVLLGSDEWTPSAFAPWVEERRERMRRLMVSAAVTTAIRCTFTDDGRARRRRVLDSLMVDPNVLAQIGSSLVGPEAFPPEPFSAAGVASTLEGAPPLQPA